MWGEGIVRMAPGIRIYLSRTGCGPSEGRNVRGGGGGTFGSVKVAALSLIAGVMDGARYEMTGTR